MTHGGEISIGLRYFCAAVECGQSELHGGEGELMCAFMDCDWRIDPRNSFLDKFSRLCCGVGRLVND